MGVKKIKMENIVGDFVLQFDEFPEWEDFPERGHIDHRDSRVFEIEFSDGFFTFNVKCHIFISYLRWYRPFTTVAPEEDSVTEYEFIVDTISGTREYGGNSMVLSVSELEQIDKILKDKIEFI